MTSQDTGGVRLSHGRAADSPCRRGALVTVVAYGVAWMHCTRVGRHWRRVGGTSGRWGLRAVSTTLGQWIPTLVEQAYSRRDSKRTRRPTMTTGTLCRLRARERCRRTREGGAGLCGKTHGLSLLRGPVSTALTLPSLPSKHPAGIVEILRFFFGVRRRCACDVSTMDTHAPSCLAPQPPSPPGPPACPGFLPERVSQKS